MTADRAGARLAMPRQRETSAPAGPAGGDLDHQLLDIFFDRVPMGIAVFGTDLRLQRCNKTWARFFVHYLGVPQDYAAPGRSMFDLIPGNEDALAPLIDGVLAGQVVRQAAHRLEAAGVVTFWDVTFAPTFRDGEVVGFVDIVTDATERVLAYDALQTRVATLAAMASSMTVDQPLQATIQQATAAVVDATGAVACTSLVHAPGDQQIFASTGMPHGYGDGMLASWALGVSSPQTRAIAEQRVAIVRGAAAQTLANPLYGPLHPYVDGSWQDLVVVPLDTLGRNFGSLTAYYEAGYPIEDDLAVLQAIGDLAATAVENARLLATAEHAAATLERQRLARELHDSVSQALFSMTLHARTAQRLLGH